MSESYNKLVKTLKSIFEMDKADLDFGIYRIMNQKRDDVMRFLENDLLAQVKEAFADYVTDGQSDLQQELDAAIEQAKQFGAPDPEQTPAVQAIRQKMDSAVNVRSVENEVYSHLHKFFSRYYDKGDFISQRRYKNDTYAIPYEGEEVKLYWANHDQYYIKSSEHLRDYAFLVQEDGGEKSIRIKLVEADTEKDNVKARSGEERRFVLDEANPLSVEGGELHIHFHYIPVGKKKQEKLNAEAVKLIFEQDGFDEWLELLGQKAPTEKNPHRTVLEKHLNDYTARNTFDYFIHKDLGGFLKRELDFYIKNEVFHLDDIDDAAFEVTEQHLRKIKVLRIIAHKIIRMLAQLEDFQKKLWLKKKFVVETNYCITVDRLAEHTDLLEQVFENEDQLAEWKELFALDLDKLEQDYESMDWGGFLSLPEYQYLVMDTKFFDQEFKDKLIATIDDLDEQRDGLLIHSENFQALHLLKSSFLGTIKCVYIDPPYNTGGDGFSYKDRYQHASWLSMVTDRLLALYPTLRDDAVVFSSIDAIERNNLENSLDTVFGRSNRVEEIIWVQNTTKNQSPTYSTNHEYIEVYSKNINTVKSKFSMFRESKPGYTEIMELMERMNPDYLSVAEIQTSLRQLFRNHKSEIAKDASGAIDEWKGIYNYNRVEYRNCEGNYVEECDAKNLNAKIWVWREDNPSMPQIKEDSQKPEFRNPESPLFRFYKPLHPITKQPCPAPKRGWSWPYEPHGKQKNCFSGLARAHRIAWGDNENKIPQTKRFLHEVETNVSKSVINDFTDGEKELTNIFGQSRTFGGPKPTTLIRRFCQQSAVTKEYVCDFFAGSGTTGQAVIDLNHEDGLNRKYLLVEMGEHFETVLKPRLSKVIYSKGWKDGKPVSRKGISHCYKYLRLESYEDTLNNLILNHPTQQQGDMLKNNTALREDYMLGYALDVETSDSPSLLNIEQFEDPFNYKLNIGSGSVGATKPATVDLVETFNYLIGLTVKHIDTLRGFKVVTGTNRQDESVLVIWRNVKALDNAALEVFMDKQGYNPKDTEYDHIYVNGDHTLEDPHSKVKMTEIEFKRLMFDVQDV